MPYTLLFQEYPVGGGGEAPSQTEMGNSIRCNEALHQKKLVKSGAFMSMEMSNFSLTFNILKLFSF